MTDPNTNNQTNTEAEAGAETTKNEAEEAGKETSTTTEGETGTVVVEKEMRAVVLNGFGGLKSVKIVKRPVPSLADGEVLIRVQLW